MNRTLILGIAMFLAVVGIALLGGEKVAVAGHGCCCGGGCCGGGECCGGGCCGGGHCHCHGLFHHHHRCCCGGDCCGGGGCCGGEAPSCGGEKAAPAPAPAPPAPMTSIQSDRAPFAFSHVSYRR